MDVTVCAWRDDENGASHTDCGGMWECYDATPPENGMKYCPFCGKLIAWCSYVEAELCGEDDDPERMAALGNCPDTCPACGSDDLHSASLDGEDAISCCDCVWIATIASFQPEGSQT